MSDFRDPPGRVSNTVRYAESWDEFKTLVETDANRGERVVLEAAGSPYTAGQTVAIDRPLTADASRAVVEPETDAQTLVEVTGQGSFGERHPKLYLTGRSPSGTYSGPMVFIDESSSNYGKSLHGAVKLANEDGASILQSGEAVRVESGGLGGNHVTGVFLRCSVVGFETGLHIESGSSSGEYVNGNYFEGEMFGPDTAVRCIEGNGNLAGNEFRMQIDNAGDSSYGVRFQGRSNVFRGVMFDANDYSGAGFDFDTGAYSCWGVVQNQTVNAASISGGPRGNYVYNFYDNSLYYDAGGSVQQLRKRSLGAKGYGNGNTPTAGDWPQGALVENTDDGTIWVKDSSSTMRQLI